MEQQRPLLLPQCAPVPPLRCRQFPSLINCCTIDWYSQWPEDALISVSRKFLAGTDLGGDEVSRGEGMHDRAIGKSCQSIMIRPNP